MCYCNTTNFASQNTLRVCYLAESYTCTILVPGTHTRIQASMLADVVVAIPAVDLAVEAVGGIENTMVGVEPATARCLEVSS